MPKINDLGVLCCGCGACSASCRFEALEIRGDTFGFARPIVDANRCVECGSCDRVCPVLNDLTPNYNRHVLWAVANNESLLDSSSSGGIFGLLAHSVIKRNGIVYGAMFQDRCLSLSHNGAWSLDDLELLKRSKYLQSNIGRNTFEEIRAYLESGRRVLFSGTPCQVTGVRRYLGKLASSAHFTCVDVVCHGVPSPKLWDRYIGYLSQRLGSGIKEVNFRSKKPDWQNFHFLIEADNGAILDVPFPGDWYCRAFLKNASLRPSCFDCRCKNRSGSDLTLGDFWGIDELLPSLDGSRGVSAVIVNTEAGERLVSEISEHYSYGSVDLADVLKGNQCLVDSVQPFQEYSAFMEDLALDLPVSKLIKRWPFRPHLWQRAASRIGRFIKHLSAR